MSASSGRAEHGPEEPGAPDRQPSDVMLRDIRDSYDRLAEEYAARIADELRHKPLDRELLLRFAEETRGRGRVCDLGCGPGHVARFLRDAGADVFGVDLSPGMVEQARRLNPDLEFREGDMLALDLPAEALAGIAAFYAIVNLPPGAIDQAFRDMLRVLAPGGLLLLAFHLGDEVLREEELWGQRISMDFYLLQTTSIVAALEAAGFTVEETIERAPYPDVEYPSRRSYIFARKPKQPGA